MFRGFGGLLIWFPDVFLCVAFNAIWVAFPTVSGPWMIQGLFRSVSIVNFPLWVFLARSIRSSLDPGNGVPPKNQILK